MIIDNSPFMLFYGKILSILPQASVPTGPAIELSPTGNDCCCIGDQLLGEILHGAGPGAMTFPTGWLELFVARLGSGADQLNLASEEAAVTPFYHRGFFHFVIF